MSLDITVNKRFVIHKRPSGHHNGSIEIHWLLMNFDVTMMSADFSTTDVCNTLNECQREWELRNEKCVPSLSNTMHLSHWIVWRHFTGTVCFGCIELGPNHHRWQNFGVTVFRALYYLSIVWYHRLCSSRLHNQRYGGDFLLFPIFAPCLASRECKENPCVIHV